MIGLDRHVPLDDLARPVDRSRERPPEVWPLFGVDRVDLGDVVRPERPQQDALCLEGEGDSRSPTIATLLPDTPTCRLKAAREGP